MPPNDDERIARTLPSPGAEPPREHRTLFIAAPGKADREGARKRTTRRAEETTDVRRFRGILAATVIGAAAACLAAVITTPSGGFTSPGPLSRPHESAHLACASCHLEGAAGEAVPVAASASKACAGCHGPHASTRAGHARLAAKGAMTCATCHTVHRGDQGVTFSPDGPPIRWGGGVEATEPAVAYRPAGVATVAIVTAASCAGCHDTTSPRDPVARCLVPGQEALGGARPVACFDEHRLALPPDLVGERAGKGVCASQHAPDRALAWEAAREVAARTPVVRGGALGGGAFTWLGTGLVAAALALGATRGRDAWLRQRRAKAAAPTRAMQAAKRVRLPTIDTGTCLGCYACVDACPYDVLEITSYVAVVARPDACCGLTLCEQRCPNGSLQITDGDPIGDRPRLADDLESLDVPGLFLAGDVTGLPLIKNAILQGSRAAANVAASLAKSTKRVSGVLDLVIVGAGPAGISAALRARELGLACQTIEQGSVAQSIQSFPRGKLVFDQPLEMPVTGKLWLKESSKEELLSHWLRIVRQERLGILEDTRMTGLARGADGVFTVTAEPREGGARTELRARRVLLAIGQRGTPRRLPFELSPEVEPMVHYHLADARSFEGKRVLVVGLGDVAMEAAIALARQPDTHVTLVHRGAGFSRGKSRNIDEVKRMVASKRVGLRVGASVVSLARGHAVVRQGGDDAPVACDAVLVLIGSIPPWETLRRAGVRTLVEAPAGGPTATLADAPSGVGDGPSGAARS